MSDLICVQTVGTLMQKVDFEKISRLQQNKQNYPVGKELRALEISYCLSLQALSMYKKVKMESNAMKNVGGSMRFLQQQSPNELEGYMVPQLQRLQQQLRNDLDKVEQVK